MGNTEWCALAPNQLRAIDTAKVVRHYRAGETIYNQGDACTGIHCVESGSVAVRFMETDGSSKMLRIAEAGRTLGYSDFFGKSGYRTSAVALNDVTVCHIPAEPLHSALTHNPALGFAFLAHGAEDLREADAQNVGQALHNVRARTVQLLLSLKDKHGEANDAGEIEVKLPLAWQQAAEMIGARPESVSRALQALAEDELVKVSGRMVTIMDLDLLLDDLETAQD
jgi:CRP-like cAMP-binding protein